VETVVERHVLERPAAPQFQGPLEEPRGGRGGRRRQRLLAAYRQVVEDQQVQVVAVQPDLVRATARHDPGRGADGRQVEQPAQRRHVRAHGTLDGARWPVGPQHLDEAWKSTD
jgi:hypothetical protein